MCKRPKGNRQNGSSGAPPPNPLPPRAGKGANSGKVSAGSVEKRKEEGWTVQLQINLQGRNEKGEPPERSRVT